MSIIPQIRNTLHFLNHSGEMVERTLRSGLAISRLSKKAIHISASIANAWNVTYLSHTLWDLGEIATASAFIEINDDGTLKQENGNYVWKGVARSFARIALCIARVLSLITSLHDAHAYRLKQLHLARLYVSVASIWTVATVGAFVSAVHELRISPNSNQACMELIQRTFDFAAITFDLLRNTSSSCGIVSAVLNLGAGLSTLAYELAWHRKI